MAIMNGNTTLSAVEGDVGSGNDGNVTPKNGSPPCVADSPLSVVGSKNSNSNSSSPSTKWTPSTDGTGVGLATVAPSQKLCNGDIMATASSNSSVKVVDLKATVVHNHNSFSNGSVQIQNGRGSLPNGQSNGHVVAPSAAWCNGSVSATSGSEVQDANTLCTCHRSNGTSETTPSKTMTKSDSRLQLQDTLSLGTAGRAENGHVHNNLHHHTKMPNGNHLDQDMVAKEQHNVNGSFVSESSSLRRRINNCVDKDTHETNVRRDDVERLVEAQHQNGSCLPGVQNGASPHSTDTMCKSCEAEAIKLERRNKLNLDEGEEEETQVDLLSRSQAYFKRSLSNVLPDWLREPEFMVHAKPRDKTFVHHHADSLFSTTSGFTNYYGILNLCLILLVVGNARLFLENIIKYGILMNLAFTEWFFFDPYYWPNLLLTLSLVIYPAVALLTEKLLAKSFISNRTGCVLYIVNLTCLLTIPASVIYHLHPIIAFSQVTLGITTICFLKLLSYWHTNFWCRELRDSGHTKIRRRKSYSSPGVDDNSSDKGPKEDDLLLYPNNLNAEDLAYFMFAPTLCYELNFPRSARIRKRFLLKRIVEMVFLSWLIVGLVQQWIVPIVRNAQQPLAEMEVFKMVERLLKLSIPNHFIWLIFFYAFFHSALNVVAELLKFADREFYKDWWNAETVGEFWQNWNIPVHRFATRHVYKPLLRRGVTKMHASVVVFMLSAFFHEYLVSVPLRMFKVWAFSGMLMQVPMAWLTANYIRGKWGNIIMWLTVIVGQPVAILAYFHDYYIVGVMRANATSSG